MRSDRLTSIAKKIQACFEQATLSSLGRSTGFELRSRTITAERFIPSLLTSLSHGRAASIAELHRDFIADHGRFVNYKPYYERLDTNGFAEMMRAVTKKMCQQLRTSVLSSVNCRPLLPYEDVIIHDGTSFALRDGLSQVFPGRFTQVSPAAIELHVTMSLFSDNFTKVSVSPDKECERHYAPPPETLKNKLFLADRGYDAIPYLQAIADSGGAFVVRLRSIQDPTVIRVVRETTSVKRHEGRRLSEVLPFLSKSKVHDLDLMFSANRKSNFSSRMVLRWNRKKKEWHRLLTNIARCQSGKQQILATYQIRWQIELLFKQFKSFSCLRKFQTNKAHIALGLIWAAIAAAFLKRFIAHSCQECLYGDDISTHKLAKSGRFMARILSGASANLESLTNALENTISFARRSLRRARLKRDRTHGRLALGLLLCHQDC